MINKKEIYTIGHSNHSMEYFLELLKTWSIDCIIDVRSTAASSFNPHFNKTPLRAALKSNGIEYMHFKNEFGARHTNVNVLDENGRVDFNLFRKTNDFQQGVHRVNIGVSKGFRIALMCSEGNPLECHRFSMISHYLNQTNYEVKHILKNKEIRTHEELELSLLEKYSKKLPKVSLFEPTIDIKSKLKEAYRFHNQEIGWINQNHSIVRHYD